jgi:hypothetical protein
VVSTSESKRLRPKPRRPLAATPPLQTYGKCFESVESYSGTESKCISCGGRHSVAQQAFGNAAGRQRGSAGADQGLEARIRRFSVVADPLRPAHWFGAAFSDRLREGRARGRIECGRRSELRLYASGAAHCCHLLTKNSGCSAVNFWLAAINAFAAIWSWLLAAT